MSTRARLRRGSWRLPHAPWLALAVALLAVPAHAQLQPQADVNVSKKAGNDTECAIAGNPLDALQLFAICSTTTPGLVAVRSIDGGMSWTYSDPADKVIADGTPGQQPRAEGDPSVAWDAFGNLYVAYLNLKNPAAGVFAGVTVLLSTDGGKTFSVRRTFGGSSDQPTVVAARTTAAGMPVAVWVVWNQGGRMVATHAAVTGLGGVGTFSSPQVIPGTSGCSFGDVAIAPDGVAVQACEVDVGGGHPSQILVSTDSGRAAGDFASPVVATTTNVTKIDQIPAQHVVGVDAEPGLAFDISPGSPHSNRLYLVYTEEAKDESNDTDVMLRFRDPGTGWSAPIRVNDDDPRLGRSQFLPRIAVSPFSGDIVVCWHDARNSATNVQVEVFCSMATRTAAVPRFLPNVRISDQSSQSSLTKPEFGDYSGLALVRGAVHAIWADRANGTHDNPNQMAQFDALTDRITGGMALSAGDPHLTTLTGEHYDFNGAGDFVALRGGDGMEIQLRLSPVAMPWAPVADAYHGLATQRSLCTGVAARVGGHRVTLQAARATGDDPGVLQLRIDGQPTRVDEEGVALGDGGRVAKAPLGEGVVITFPNGTIAVVTAALWADGTTWYLGFSAHRTTATEGLMGAVYTGDWLPALSDGTGLGPLPETIGGRYEQLYGSLAQSWRVAPENTLFDDPGDGAPGCDLSGWPRERPDCSLPQPPPATRLGADEARRICAGLRDERVLRDCAADVLAAGEPRLADGYRRMHMLLDGATLTQVVVDGDTSRVGQAPTFIALVEPVEPGGPAPAGSVQFFLDGFAAGAPVPLDAAGRASLTTASLAAGSHEVWARFIPASASGFFPSRSAERPYVVLPPQGG